MSRAVALAALFGALFCALAFAAEPALVVSGFSSTPLNLSLDDLAKLPRAKATAKDHVYEGVLISTLLKRAGMKLEDGMRGPLLAMCVIAEAHDGYRALFSLPELDPAFTTGMVMVADHVDGQPLTDRDGPLKIVVPGDKRADRWVRGVERLRITRIEGKGASLSGAIETVPGKALDKLLIELLVSESNVVIAAATDKKFQFPDLPPGIYNLRVSAPRFDSLSIESITINAGQKVDLPPVVLTAPPFGPPAHVSLRINGKTLGSLSGRVVGDGGAPIEGAGVTLLGATTAATVTDSRGTYTFPDLAAGSYAVQVDQKDFSLGIQARLLVQPGYDSVSQDLNLERCTDPRCGMNRRTKHSTRR